MNRNSTARMIIDDGYCHCNETCPMCGRRYRPSPYTVISGATISSHSVWSASTTGVDNHGISFMQAA